LARLVRIVAALFLLLAAVIVVRAATLPSRQLPVEPAARLELDVPALASRLAGGLRFPTISNQDGAGRDDAAFEGLHRYLEEQYPLAHQTLERETVNGLSLLYTWRGSDPTLAPLLLLAHQDVVPVEPGTESSWEHPPFAGEMVDGFVWGRGALDDKVSLLGQLEAVESLLQAGVQPRRTVHLAFGHDEEIGGLEGASKIAALLGERGVKPLLVLDEGGSILQGVVPGVEAPVAGVGIAEKGYLSVELTYEGQGGHSSTPPAESAIGILGEAVHRLEQAPLHARLEGSPRRMLEEYVGPEASFPYRIVFGNLWLFGPVVKQVLTSVPAANATIRTTTAVTIFQAGLKDNVLPSRARAVVNFRILPGDTIESVLAHVENAVNDPRIKAVGMVKQREPSPPSEIDTEGWKVLVQSVREVSPETIVTPYLMLAGTDARHYRTLADSVYRFMPLRLELEDTKRIHGTNERVGVENYADLVRVYRRLLENAVR
jgi:carboxypeptidase PM20D1